jgi:glutamate dehydrogenase
MSGDVFGNGMLLSKTQAGRRLRPPHIFLDPDPDPAASWAERKRLFDLPRSSWDDYDRALISGAAASSAHRQVDPALARGPRPARI